jgi:hypothetical protein
MHVLIKKGGLATSIAQQDAALALCACSYTLLTLSYTVNTGVSPTALTQRGDPFTK